MPTVPKRHIVKERLEEEWAQQGTNIDGRYITIIFINILYTSSAQDHHFLYVLLFDNKFVVLDEVSKNVNFRPIDSIVSIYVTHIRYLNLRTVHRGLAPLGQVKNWPYGSSTLGQEGLNSGADPPKFLTDASGRCIEDASPH